MGSYGLRDVVNFAGVHRQDVATDGALVLPAAGAMRDEAFKNFAAACMGRRSVEIFDKALCREVRQDGIDVSFCRFAVGFGSGFDVV